MVKGISLFSGAGGDTIGMENAGIDVCGFVEFDNDAITSHLLNLPKSKLIGTDICNIEDDTIKEYHDIDIIFGGFPCFIRGTRVLTSNGNKRIEDVQLTDKLMAHSGTFQKIINKQYKIYSGSIYSIKTNYNVSDIQCT